MLRETDIFIVGGGPAGLAAAIALRGEGFDVVVADSAQPPIDKACGEGLMPDALEALARLGVSLDLNLAFQFRGIRFLGEGISGEGISVDASFPRGFGLGVRRTSLHQVLMNRAAAAGASLWWGDPVRGISGKGVVVGDQTIRCRWIVGADGENSRVRKWAGLDTPPHQVLRFGFRRHYQAEPWTDCVEIYWGPGFQIYVTPVGPREVCVALTSRDSHRRLEQSLNHFPSLSSKLRGARIASAERGAISTSRRLRRLSRGNVILLGDASGSVDAITGDGLQLSFQQGPLLATALRAGDLTVYEAAHRRLSRRPALMGRLMLSLDDRAWLRRRALRALAAEPGIFAKQLAMHVGALSPAAFVRCAMLPLGWSILAS